MTNNHHSSSHSTKRMTSSDGIIKDEPDFVETHCRWLGCDRELHTQEQLVKVRSSRIVLVHLLLPITFSILLMPFLGFYSTPISPLPAAYFLFFFLLLTLLWQSFWGYTIVDKQQVLDEMNGFRCTFCVFYKCTFFHCSIWTMITLEIVKRLSYVCGKIVKEKKNHLKLNTC